MTTVKAGSAGSPARPAKARVKAEPKVRNRDGRMSLGSHLREFRKRLFRAALGILIGAVVGWILSDPILNALNQPVRDIVDSQGRGASLNFTDVSSAFDLRLQIALTVGVVIASPVWLYQLWAFLVPGLTRKEKQYAVGFVLTAVPLFLAGATAGWYVLPHMVGLLTGFAPSGSTSIIDARPYYDFVLKLVIAIGVAFVLPVLLVLLNFAGVVSAKGILKSWRIAILVIILFTAIATPAADVASMFLLAVPMIVLFYTAALIATLHDRRAVKRAELQEKELEAAGI